MISGRGSSKLRRIDGSELRARIDTLDPKRKLIKSVPLFNTETNCNCVEESNFLDLFLKTVRDFVYHFRRQQPQGIEHVFVN